MEELFLNAEMREGTGRIRAKEMRENGFIPAVIYSEGTSSSPIKVTRHDLIQLVHRHRIEGTLIRLRLKGDKAEKVRPCLIKEIQYHPVHGNIIHVDFNEVSLTKSIRVNVPVVSDGEPAGVKQDGGSLEHIMWEVEVECLPTNIPAEFKVDVRAMKLGESVQVKDLPVPAGVKVISDLNAVVLSVAAPMKEEVPAEGVEGEVSQEPEVIKEKKPVAEEEGKAAAAEKEKK